MAQEPIPNLPIPTEQWHAIAHSFELSPQQTRIVELILRNCCDKQIAAALGLKLPTIKTYLKRTYQRVGAEDRLSLVLKIFTAYASSRECQPAG